MRKAQITTLVATCILFPDRLIGQLPIENEIENQVISSFKPANAERFFAWFESPTFYNFILTAVILSGLYFTTMLLLFVLINKEIFSVKENSLISILLDDWIQDEVLIKSKEKVVPADELRPVKNPIFENIPSLEYPSLEVIDLELNIQN